MGSCTTCCDCGISLYKKRSKTIRVTVSGLGDITNAKIWCTVKGDDEDSDTDARIEKKSLNNGGDATQAQVTDGVNGIIEIYILPVDTEEMNAGDFRYDVVLELNTRVFQIVEPSLFQVKQPTTIT